ncbi:MAG: purine-nucleoside phosphorylase [Bacteroidetes bacterium]|nr:purine-nucleoside phosphorylase [Bacteroidota bacterium]
MLEQIKQTTEYIKQQINFTPEIGIILGTGLGNLTSEIDIKFKIPYQSIPNFPVSTVAGHSGQLIFGMLGNKKVVAMQGRFHYYEGYTMKEVTFPIRVMKLLGIKLLILSNASGGMNPDFKIGDMMIIKDHINMMGDNPLIGKNYEELGPRFPDMHIPYDKALIAKGVEIAKKNDVNYQVGVYVGVTGPTYETPAEYKLFRILGGDAVGMSTVPEVIVARQMDIPCFAVSVITDLGVEGKIMEITHEEVIVAAKAAEPKMTQVIKELIETVEL